MAYEVADELECCMLDDTITNTKIINIKYSLHEEYKDGPFRFMELFSWTETPDLRWLLIATNIKTRQQFFSINV